MRLEEECNSELQQVELMAKCDVQVVSIADDSQPHLGKAFYDHKLYCHQLTDKILCLCLVRLLLIKLMVYLCSL